MQLTGESAPIAVHILTGFLGSGKTSLLRQILREEAYGDTAVLINEFGEVGLDQVLIGEIAPDVVLLNSGCLCCTLRGELRDALEDLLSKRLQGSIPPFKRVIIESTGLAKPALILSTIFADPRIKHHYTIGTIVTTVDCLHSTQTTQRAPEWLEQIAAANTLVLTKQDLVDQERIEHVREQIHALNATATLYLKENAPIGELFPHGNAPVKSAANIHMAMGKFSQLISANKDQNRAQNNSKYLSYFDHESTTATTHINEKTPLDWEAFGVWLSMLVHAHGDHLLRIKGIVHIADHANPIVIQGVQHVIYPPEHLASWEGNTPQTDLIFITRNLSSSQIKKSFETFVLKKIVDNYPA